MVAVAHASVFGAAVLHDVNVLDLLIPGPGSFYVMAPSATLTRGASLRSSSAARA
jgi:hypothetical protein